MGVGENPDLRIDASKRKPTKNIKVQLTKEPRSPISRKLHQCQQPNEGISSHYQLRLRIPQCQIHKLQETQIENMSMNQNKPQARKKNFPTKANAFLFSGNEGIKPAERM